MPEGYRIPVRKSTIVLWVFFLAIAVFGVKTSLSDPPIGTFYYPPGNEPPGPPPNYNQVDTSYFMGTPVIPMPPPDSGGVYIWVDSTGWNIANHIYSQGYSLEQFHGSVLAMLDSPPAPGVNVFADGFEIFGDTTANRCYLQNDRWGWYQWSENLYEIWWDVSTREWKQGSGDPNDFMVINIAGCAIDFNVWSSGHGGTFDTDQIYLGGSMVPLSSVPGFVDTYPGIYDPYQSQAGPDPTADPNITIFAALSGTGTSYNKDGPILSGQTYPCGQVLGQDYGDRFVGPFVYEGNGVQFSSSCLSDPCASNNPPVASSPVDTSIFVCGLDEICLAGFTCSDPDNNLLSVEVTGGSLSGDTVCLFPVEGTNTITLICTDECGAADTAVTVVTVDLNEPPVVNSPDDTTVSVCDLSQICISGFTYSDVDGNISSVDVTGGTLNGDTVCFTPVEGANAITMIVTDVCGEADTAIKVVTVGLNEPPVAGSPSDTTMFVCDLNQICISGFTYSDADGNISSVDVTGGTLNGDTVCFTPLEGVNTITMIVTDVCGEADTAITVVTVGLNEPPVANSPNDTTMFVCDLSQICISGFTYSDADGNISSVDVTGGTLNGDTVCFTPLEGVNTITMIVTDACGAADTAITVVTVGLNEPPVADSPNDTTMFVCDLRRLCISGFTYSDADGNISSVDVTGGTLSRDTVCFDPVEGANTITMIVTDACGEADTAITVVTVNLNEPPVADSPNDTTMFACDLSQICISGFTYSDADGNISSVDVTGGTLNGDQVCLDPLIGANTITLIVTDSCGEADTAITVVNIALNTPPYANGPDDTTMFLCNLDQICLPGFDYGDPDNNIVSVDIVGGTLTGDSICFMPFVGVNTVSLIVTDECGVADTATTIVNVDVNTAPSVSCPGDTGVSFVCEVSEICVGPFTSSDLDDNLDSAYVITDGFSGTFDGTTFCFTPNSRAIYQIKYVAVDLCGETDTCAVNVDVQMTNEPPTVQCAGDTSIVACDLSDICIPGFGYDDANDNIATVEVSTGIYDNGSICFTPAVGANTIALTVTDSCGIFASCTTTVTVIMNSAPQITCINDTTMVVDDLSDICLGGIEITDPDNNIASIDVIGGSLVGDEICFTPIIGINTLTIVATDDCGEADTCEVDVTVGYCSYLPGDANADFNVNGLDITIMVNFFKGGPPLPDTCDCRPDVAIYPFFGAGDTNGDCAFNGLDVTYLYTYLTYIVDVILYCPSCPPTGGWVTSEENGQLPVTAKFKEGKRIEYPGIGKR